MLSQEGGETRYTNEQLQRQNPSIRRQQAEEYCLTFQF